MNSTNNIPNDGLPDPSSIPSWPIFQGTRTAPAADALPALPLDPAWRQFGQGHKTAAITPREVPWNDDDAARRGLPYHAHSHALKMVNSALFLKKPLLIGGRPGTGKSSLAYAVAHELGLGAVLRWNITSRSTLREGLYDYDALARLNDHTVGEQKNIGEYFRLGPLGTALLPHSRPRVLLIDEIDKSDIDLPNDLLNILDEGNFIIPELFRHRAKEKEVRVLPFDGDDPIEIQEGRVQCTNFPFVVMTSNGERDFPPAMLRRCLRLNLPSPSTKRLTEIVRAQLYPEVRFPNDDSWPKSEVGVLIERFQNQARSGEVATDQLLDAVHIVLSALPSQSVEEDSDGTEFSPEAEELIKSLLAHLSSAEVGANTEDDTDLKVV